MAEYQPVENHSPDGGRIDPFANIVVDTHRGGAPYARFLELFRTLQDKVAGSDPPDDLWNEASEQIATVVSLLEPWSAPESPPPSGTRIDLPGRGNPMLLPFVVTAESKGRVEGHVIFRRYHLGGNGAAHGGTLPLLFDEVLGRLANSGGLPIARTAFLKVNFRSVTPIGIELHVEASLDQIEGRKRWATARLFNGETLVADAEALFVQLRPGQP
jgi:acyl-coenzyme A thioesterase PaaI-like protein